MTDQAIELLSITELFEQLSIIKNDIDTLKNKASQLPNKKSRIKILNRALVKSQLYEKLYYTCQCRVREKIANDKKKLASALMRAIPLSEYIVH